MKINLKTNLIKDSNSIMRNPCQELLINLPTSKVPSPNTITLGVKTSKCEFWRETPFSPKQLMICPRLFIFSFLLIFHHNHSQSIASYLPKTQQLTTPTRYPYYGYRPAYPIFSLVLFHGCILQNFPNKGQLSSFFLSYSPFLTK